VSSHSLPAAPDPFAPIGRLSRMASRSTASLVLIASGALVLSGCSGPAAASRAAPWDAFRGGKIVHSWSVDAGRFAIQPVSSAPAVPAGQMATQLAASELGNTESQRLAWGYGRVTIASKTASRGTPLFRHRDAWVVVLAGFITSCLRGDPDTPRPTHPTPGYIVLVLDGHTGTAGAVYSSTHSSCGGPVQPPRAWPLTETVSMPWTLEQRTNGGAIVSAPLPSCSAPLNLQGMGYDRTATERWQVLATLTLTGAACRTRSTQRQQVSIRFLSPHTAHLAHGPIGPEPPASPHTVGGHLQALVAAR
jgi:hypothetical protein